MFSPPIKMQTQHIESATQQPRPNVEVQLNLGVRLNEDELKALVAAHGRSAPASLAQWFLKQVCAGGMALEAKDVAYLNSIIPGGFRSASTLIEQVEKAVRRERGQHTFTLSIDPALMPPIKEWIESAGISLDQFMQDNFQLMMSNGFLFHMQPTGGVLNLSASDRETIGKVIGKDPKEYTGEDVVEFFRRVGAGEIRVSLIQEAAAPAPALQPAVNLSPDDVILAPGASADVADEIPMPKGRTKR